MASIAMPPASEASPIKATDVMIFALAIARDRHAECS
jgi:hypothetical protein